jgi:hypothetical protein
MPAFSLFLNVKKRGNEKGEDEEEKPRLIVGIGKSSVQSHSSSVT